MHDAGYWIRHLGMEKHPEGGYFRETYRSSETIAADPLPRRFGSSRSFSSAIFFLLGADDFSAFHRLRADETWHFYYGGTLAIHMLREDGSPYVRSLLGPEPERGHAFQLTIPHGCWFAAEPIPGAAFSLVGCTVAPGFDFEDFELGERADLVERFPAHRALIERMTRA